jgi:hypothetical protein
MSQIIRHFTLFALLLKISLSSSSPGTSSVTHTVKALTNTPIEALSSATLLTGYVTNIFYEGSSCSNPYYANSYILNSCYRESASTYRFFSANSSSVTQTTYTDSQCTMGASEISFSYTEGACDTSDSTKVYVSSSSVWDSDSVTATERWTIV